MDSFIAELVSDILVLRPGELRSKYEDKIPSGITLDNTVDSIFKQNLENKLIKKTFYGDNRDAQFIYLLKTDGNEFEVFDSERGGKHGLMKYTDIKLALQDYMNRIFNELNHH